MICVSKSHQAIKVGVALGVSMVGEIENSSSFENKERTLSDEINDGRIIDSLDQLSNSSSFSDIEKFFRDSMNKTKRGLNAFSKDLNERIPFYKDQEINGSLATSFLLSKLGLPTDTLEREYETVSSQEHFIAGEDDTKMGIYETLLALRKNNAIYSPTNDSSNERLRALTSFITVMMQTKTEEYKIRKIHTANHRSTTESGNERITNLQPKIDYEKALSLDSIYVDSNDHNIEFNEDGVKLSGTMYPNSFIEKIPYERDFKVGDNCIYDGYNADYIGKIKSVGKKNIVIEEPNGKTRRLGFYEFASRNWNFDEQKTRDRNERIMQGI